MENPIIFDMPTTVEQLPFEGLIDALADGFATGCQLPVRHHHSIERKGESNATLLLMPAWSNQDDPSQYLGVKIVTVYPDNARRQLPGLVSTYILYDATTGQQLAIMDGNTITGRRTAATSALAARFLARPDSSKLLVIGSGRIASLLAYAYRAVLPIDQIAIWNVNPENAKELAARLAEEGIPATAVTDLEEAASRADIIASATLATEPLLKGRWLKPGTHIDLIGGFTPKMREADDDTVRKSSIYVDTIEALHEAGDLVHPLNAGVIAVNDVAGTLTQLCRYEIVGRATGDQITYFKAVGSGLADLVAARMVYGG